MPICKKCNNYFKITIKIDGKLRNLKSRKFCLECSPFGKHNTKNLNDYTGEVAEGSILICKSCNREYLYLRKSGHSIGKCNSCWTGDRRRELKIKSINYLGDKCNVCGYDKCVDALEFHHLDPSIKEFTLSSNNYRSWNVQKKELDKCILLCCRCHREIHSGVICEVVNASDSKSDIAGSNPA